MHYIWICIVHFLMFYILKYIINYVFLFFKLPESRNMRFKTEAKLYSFTLMVLSTAKVYEHYRNFPVFCVILKGQHVGHIKQVS